MILEFEPQIVMLLQFELQIMLNSRIKIEASTSSTMMNAGWAVQSLIKDVKILRIIEKQLSLKRVGNSHNYF